MTEGLLRGGLRASTPFVLMLLMLCVLECNTLTATRNKNASEACFLPQMCRKKAKLGVWQTVSRLKSSLKHGVRAVGGRSTHTMQACGVVAHIPARPSASHTRPIRTVRNANLAHVRHLPPGTFRTPASPSRSLSHSLLTLLPKPCPLHMKLPLARSQPSSPPAYSAAHSKENSAAAAAAASPPCESSAVVTGASSPTSSSRESAGMFDPSFATATAPRTKLLHLPRTASTTEARSAAVGVRRRGRPPRRRVLAVSFLWEESVIVVSVSCLRRRHADGVRRIVGVMLSRAANLIRGTRDFAPRGGAGKEFRSSSWNDE